MSERQATLHDERMDLLSAMVVDLRGRLATAEAERDALRDAAKTLQRVQFILGGHSGIIADCYDKDVRDNVERALSLMREKLPPIVDAFRAAAQDGKP